MANLAWSAIIPVGIQDKRSKVLPKREALANSCDMTVCVQLASRKRSSIN